MEEQLEGAEGELRAAALKVERLRKQKKMWFEKMMRAVHRGIRDLEELERVEREEEAAAERARVAADVQALVAEESVGSAADPGFEGFDWSAVDVGTSVVDWSGFLAEEVGPETTVGGEGSGTGHASGGS